MMLKKKSTKRFLKDTDEKDHKHHTHHQHHHGHHEEHDKLSKTDKSHGKKSARRSPRRKSHHTGDRSQKDGVEPDSAVIKSGRKKKEHHESKKSNVGQYQARIKKIENYL